VAPQLLKGHGDGGLLLFYCCSHRLPLKRRDCRHRLSHRPRGELGGVPPVSELTSTMSIGDTASSYTDDVVRDRASSAVGTNDESYGG